MVKAKTTDWAIKYRPTRLEDMILDDDKREFFKGLINSAEPMSIMLSGSAGLGKTTTAEMLCNEMNAERKYMNCSGKKSRGIDAIDEIEQWALVKNLDGSPKIVIMDEADNLTPDAQKALRAIMERVGATFILTCNYPDRLIEPIHSRSHHIKLNIQNAKAGMLQMAKRAAKILDENEVKYQKKAISEIVKVNFPDFRKTLYDLQYHATMGAITIDTANEISKTAPNEIFNLLMIKDYKAIYQWTLENVPDTDYFIQILWANAVDYTTPETFPYFVVHLNDCQHEHAVGVRNKHLSLIAALAKISSDCEFIIPKG